MKVRVLATAFAAVIVMLTAAAGPAHAQQQAESYRSPAWFEGQLIDLADKDGWGPARACTVKLAGVFCSRSEEALDADLRRDTSLSGAVVQQFNCASTVRLYEHTNFGGRVVAVAARWLWINLSSVAFDNIASSYRIGACTATLADGTNGGGAWYPGLTTAGVSSSSMVSGWNDRVSSIYLT